MAPMTLVRPALGSVRELDALHHGGATRPRRWPLVVAAVAFQVALGSSQAWSVFGNALGSAGGAFGLSQTEAALPLSVMFAMLWLGASIGGRLQDRHGPRAVGLAAGTIYSVGILLAGVASGRRDYWMLIVGYGLVGGLGRGMGYVVPIAMLQKWFPDRRGLITGIAVAGFGPVITAPLAQALISVTPAVPSRAFLVFGAGYLVVSLLAASRFGDPPPRPQAPSPSGSTSADHTLAAALKSPQWYLLAAILCANVTAGIGLVSVTAAAAGQVAGYGVADAAVLTGVMGVLNGLGRPLWGWLSEHTGRMPAFLAMLGLQGLCLMALPHAASPALFAALAAVVYVCYGGGCGTMPATVGDLYGLRHMGSIYGLMNVAISLGGTVGPLWIAVTATSGSFAAAFTELGSVALAAAALPLLVRTKLANR